MTDPIDVEAIDLDKLDLHTCPIVENGMVLLSESSDWMDV
jgi:hypothetical protein